MPSKRSRSQERERKQKARSRLTDEQKKVKLEKASLDKAFLRSLKTKEDKDYDKIVQKFKKRDQRKNRSGEEIGIQNQKAKEGMQVMRSKGRIRDFTVRSKGNLDEMSEWKLFRNKSRSHHEYLEEKKPDIVQRLNDEAREEKEKAKRRIDEKKDEWEYNGESGEWVWLGVGDPPDDSDDFQYDQITKEQLEEFRKEEAIEHEADIKEKKRILKEKRNVKRKLLKEAMEKPIDPPPVQPLSEYEKCRDDIVRERNEAMAASGLFSKSAGCMPTGKAVTTDISSSSDIDTATELTPEN